MNQETYNNMCAIISSAVDKARASLLKDAGDLFEMAASAHDDPQKRKIATKAHKLLVKEFLSMRGRAESLCKSLKVYVSKGDGVSKTEE